MYAKVFRCLFDGSMRGHPDLILVFVYLLCNASEDGIVDLVPDKVADDTGLSRDRVAAALRALESPDPDSRTEVEEGRRIMPLSAGRSWGWQIVNFRLYREIADRVAMRQSERDRKRIYRASKACPVPVPDARGLSASASASDSAFVPGGAGGDLGCGKYNAAVLSVLDCRVEFRRLRPTDVAKELIDAESNPRRDQNLAEFLRDAANCQEAPRNPICMLRRYLASEGPPGLVAKKREGVKCRL